MTDRLIVRRGYIEPHTHGISKLPTNRILNTLPMVYRTPYQWYIEPPRNVSGDRH